VKFLQLKDSKGLIIDLRNNPGGLLNNAMVISDMFLNDGVIVSTVNKNGYVIYEHWVTRNWLRKPAGNFMLRIGDIIEQFVVPHPRYKLNYLYNN
jgi:hypothetical protein